MKELFPSFFPLSTSNSWIDWIFKAPNANLAYNKKWIMLLHPLLQAPSFFLLVPPSITERLLSMQKCKYRQLTAARGWQTVGRGTNSPLRENPDSASRLSDYLQRRFLLCLLRYIDCFHGYKDLHFWGRDSLLGPHMDMCLLAWWQW